MANGTDRFSMKVRKKSFFEDKAYQRIFILQVLVERFFYFHWAIFYGTISFVFISIE